MVFDVLDTIIISFFRGMHKIAAGGVWAAAS